MKEKRVYICELCDSEYHSESEAIKCEKSHVGIKNIGGVSYASGSKYPARIKVTFDDNKSVTYRLP